MKFLQPGESEAFQFFYQTPVCKSPMATKLKGQAQQIKYSIDIFTQYLEWVAIKKFHKQVEIKSVPSKYESM